MIKIYFSLGNYFIWTAEEAYKVRKDYRIVGNLIGCLPCFPLQNIQSGLPMLLMDCEARLLVEQGLACLIDESLIKKSIDHVHMINKKRRQSYDEQVTQCKKEKHHQMDLNIDKIIDGKKNKILNRNNDNNNITAEELSVQVDKEIQIEREKIDNFKLTESSAIVQIHTCRYPSETIDNNDIQYVWNKYAHCESNKKYFVFKHFWEQNYFVTNGIKFGGDFLVYPGDPSRYHSFYIVLCIDHNKTVNILDLISMGRMGTTVKKTFVLASVDFTNNNKVTCISIQWPKN